jgi:hypothetical protein
MKVICVECNTPLEWPDVHPQILENPSISLVAIPHGATGWCHVCKAKVGLSLRNVQAALVATPIAQEKPKSPIIIAPASLLPNGGRT